MAVAILRTLALRYVEMELNSYLFLGQTIAMTEVHCVEMVAVRHVILRKVILAVVVISIKVTFALKSVGMASILVIISAMIQTSSMEMGKLDIVVNILSSCSSTCQVENGWTCNGGSPTTHDTCT